MTLITTLSLAREADGRAQYVATPRGEHHPAIATLSIESWALPEPTPSAIRVTVEFYEPARPRTASDASRESPTREETLREGDEVTIIKNTMAGTKSPPEWLEQYLGRVGRVLWTTAGGAVVKLDNEATWFAYTELRVTK
jgi:hypothetical protein